MSRYRRRPATSQGRNAETVHNPARNLLSPEEHLVRFPDLEPGRNRIFESCASLFAPCDTNTFSEIYARFRSATLLRSYGCATRRSLQSGSGEDTRSMGTRRSTARDAMQTDGANRGGSRRSTRGRIGIRSSLHSMRMARSPHPSRRGTRSRRSFCISKWDLRFGHGRPGPASRATVASLSMRLASSSRAIAAAGAASRTNPFG